MGPISINEWLLSLGLPQYIGIFMETGWDEVQYLGSLTEQSLLDMKITEIEHRERILHSVRDLQHR